MRRTPFGVREVSCNKYTRQIPLYLRHSVCVETHGDGNSVTHAMDDAGDGWHNQYVYEDHEDPR